MLYRKLLLMWNYFVVVYFLLHLYISIRDNYSTLFFHLRKKKMSQPDDFFIPWDTNGHWAGVLRVDQGCNEEELSRMSRVMTQSKDGFSTPFQQ